MNLRITLATAAMALAAFLSASPVHAGAPGAQPAQPSGRDLSALTAIVKSSSRNPGVSVSSTFPGPSGLTGMVIHQPGQPDSIAWITSDRKSIIPGAVYDAAGDDLTREAMFTAGIFESPEKVLTAAAANTARPVGDGKSGPVVTFFLDPNCIYCHVLYGDIQPYVRAGKIRARYVLVGVVKPTSNARASAILAAANPLQAIADNEAGFDVKNEEGGYPIAGGDSAAAKAVVAANNELMRRAGSSGTPTLLFCSGGHPRMQQGVPGDVTAWIAKLGTAGSAACR